MERDFYLFIGASFEKAVFPPVLLWFYFLLLCPEGP